MVDAVFALFLINCLHKASLRPYSPNIRGVRLDKRANAPYLGISKEATDLSSLTVVALKDKLRSAGLKVSGKKADLVARLQQHAQSDEPSVITLEDRLEASVGKDAGGRDNADQDSGLDGASAPRRLRQQGTILSFSRTKGYGFITPEDGSPNVFFHVVAVHFPEGIDSFVCAGDPVEYSLGKNTDGREIADQVTGPGGKFVRPCPRQLGTVLTYSMMKGYGFVAPADGSPSLFFQNFGVHWEKDVPKNFMCAGDPVEYSIGKSGDGRDIADQVSGRGGTLVRYRPRQLGTIVSYSITKGYGFIAPEDGSPNLFFLGLGVHREKGKDAFLCSGDLVEYSPAKNTDGRDIADQVSGLGGALVRSRPRQQGTISSYNMQNGYGFITPADGSPSLFFRSFGAHWENDTDSLLCAGDPVEYLIGKGPDGRDIADQVSGPGGALLRTRPRLKGTVLSYSTMRGYGFITPQDGPSSEEGLFFHSIGVHREKGNDVILSAGDKVEYSLGRDSEGEDIADQVTGPGGAPLRSRPRQRGTIKSYSLGDGCGFISPEDGSKEIFFSGRDVRSERDVDSSLRIGAAVEYSLGRDPQGRDSAFFVSFS